MVINFSDNIVDICHNTYNIKSTEDIDNLTDEELMELYYKVELQISLDSGMEQSLKLLGNSMYGGCSHVAFYWFNLDLARDITGEARNLTHFMEDHLSSHFKLHWDKMSDIHNMLGVQIDLNKFKIYKENARPIVYGDTDSLYIEYKSLLDTIIGVEKMTDGDKLKFLLDLNLKYLNQYNKNLIDNYYLSRHVNSVHDFELETIAKSGIWLDVKKRYAQALLWKDGRFFDKPKIKVKGLEIIKSSYPKFCRDGMLAMTKKLLLEDTSTPGFIQKFNFDIGKIKDEFKHQPIDTIASGTSCNGYAKYVISDGDKYPYPLYESKAPANVKALANYNYIINKYKLEDEYIRGGKIKVYKTKANGDGIFGYIGGEYPQWASKYAPCDYEAMFQISFLDPINRLMDAANLPNIHLDGSLELSLF